MQGVRPLRSPGSTGPGSGLPSVRLCLEGEHLCYWRRIPRPGQVCGVWGGGASGEDRGKAPRPCPAPSPGPGDQLPGQQQLCSQPRRKSRAFISGASWSSCPPPGQGDWSRVCGGRGSRGGTGMDDPVGLAGRQGLRAHPWGAQGCHHPPGSPFPTVTGLLAAVPSGRVLRLQRRKREVARWWLPLVFFWCSWCSITCRTSSYFLKD